ncbi:MAG TPA: GtrA family protein [Actinophytocola sp.]|uniref:GtrA family protein n=1 Tax=Actinophytocola sp. TaxID=1872138 RepID=UPI002DBDE5DE|nr:GtrA family protein [Actinophytocola sp.]HEU5469370.1 GtrA family protein [Actinophytocola sp.]
MRLGRFLRFGVIGAVNTAAYYLLYLLLCQVIPYLAAHLLATAAAMVGSYFLNCYVTFRTRPTIRKFLLFPLSNVVSLLVTTGGLFVLVDLLDADRTVAPILVAAVAIPATFVVAQLILAGRPAEGAVRSLR